MVPRPTACTLFVQHELGKHKGNELNAIQEYDIEFKPTKIVKGQALCKPDTESKYE